jgi:hypothetical protein
MGLLTWSASMDFKGVLSISMGDRLWIFGTEFAQIFEPGTRKNIDFLISQLYYEKPMNWF